MIAKVGSSNLTQSLVAVPMASLLNSSPAGQLDTILSTGEVRGRGEKKPNLPGLETAEDSSNPQNGILAHKVLGEMGKAA